MSVSDDPDPTAVDDATPQDNAAEPKATRSDRLKGFLSACWARSKRLAASGWRRIRRGAGACWRWIAERVRARWICMMKCIGDGCRLLNFLMFVNFISDFVYKRGFRFVAATVAVAILGYLSQWLPFMREHYSTRVAVLLPLMIGGSILVLGLVLRLITNLLLAQLTNVAQAADRGNSDSHSALHVGLLLGCHGLTVAHNGKEWETCFSVPARPGWDS